MVDDAGCDPTGEEPCDEIFSDAVDDNTLLLFPPGEYKFAERHTIPEAEHFGVRGDGDDRSAVRFVRPRGTSNLLFNVRDGRKCQLSNFTIDQTQDADTNGGIVLHNADGALIENVEMAGFSPATGTVDLNVQITDPSGVGVVREFVATEGAPVGVYPQGKAVIFSGPRHRGVLRLVDCRVEEGGPGGGGVYASRTEGAVQVQGGVYRNNDVAQVRVCGEGSYVEGARIEVDLASATHVRGSYNTVRGLWWESGWQGKTGGYVSDCRFAVRSAANPRALLQVDGTGGALTVRDSQFEFDVPNGTYWGVYAAPAGQSGMGGPPPRPWDIELENVDFSGRAGGAAAVEIAERPNVVLKDVTVDQRGDHDGIVLVDPSAARIEGGSFVAGRYPIRIEFDVRRDHERCPMAIQDVEHVESLGDFVPDDQVTIPFSGGGAICIERDSFESDSVAITGQTTRGYSAFGIDEGTGDRSDSSD